MLVDRSAPELIASIENGCMPFGIALGYQNPDGELEVENAFRTNDDNHEKIRDVMVLLAKEGLYSGKNNEILIRCNARVTLLSKRFKGTGHSKMKAYLNALREKQKKGVIGIIAIIVSPYDVEDTDLFSVEALKLLEK